MPAHCHSDDLSLVPEEVLVNAPPRFPAGDVRPRRSVLAVPADDERKSAKAVRTSADEVVLDLEDAVAPGRKHVARDLLAAAVGAWVTPDCGQLAVRINPPRGAACHRDLLAIGGLPDVPLSIIVPKVETGGDLAFVDRFLDGLEAESGRRHRVGVQALVETAVGLANVNEIARASERLEALVLGYADLAASLGLKATGERGLALWLPLQQALLVAARAVGVQAVDGPHLGVLVDAAFHTSVDRARELGFDGKWAIHPRQVDVLNDAFAPTDEEVRHAVAVLQALEQAREQGGAGATALDGQMLDEAVAVAARRVLARRASAAT